MPDLRHNFINFNSSHQLCLQKQTEGDIFKSRLTHQLENECKLSKTASSPAQLWGPEDDHSQQQQRSSKSTNPMTSQPFCALSNTCKICRYRSRRKSYNPNNETMHYGASPY